jgi:hypothetical protein
MSSKTIEIIVAPDGQSRVETKGFVGGECREASRFIERALGQQEHEQLTTDFFTTPTEQQKLREGQ